MDACEKTRGVDDSGSLYVVLSTASPHRSFTPTEPPGPGTAMTATIETMDNDTVLLQLHGFGA